MSRMLKALSVVALVTLLALALNPGPDAHRDKLKAEIAARSQLAALLRLGHLAAFVSEHHTIGVGSWSTVNGRAVTYGAFGIVVVPDLRAAVAGG